MLASYVVSRLIYAVFVLLGVATVVFFISRLTGDPVVIMLPPSATTEQIEEMRTLLGLNEPLYTQYMIYLKQLIHLDFGESLRYHAPALDIIVERFPATIQLAAAALCFSLMLSLPAGILSATKKGKFLDGTIMSGVLLGQSVPVFVVGILLMLLFSVTLHWLPASGTGTWKHLILPAVALGFQFTALLTRLLRSSVIEALGSEYVRTARSKGLYPRTVMFKHVIRNSLLPVVTIVGLEIGALMGGAVITETVFAWPGVGQLLIQAITNRDFPLVQTAIIILAGIFVLVNLLVDIVYAMIDPRISY